MKEATISFSPFLKGSVAAISLFAVLCASGEAKWKNLDDKSHIAGEKLTASDLVGQVVLIYNWEVSHEVSVRVLGDIEKTWNSFKTKKFKVIGSYIGVRNEAVDAKIKEALAKYNVTFPVYHHFSLDPPPPGGPAFVCIVNRRGETIFDAPNARQGAEAASAAINAIGMPINLCADIEFKKFKSLEKQFVLGKNIASLVKKLEKETKSKDPETASEAQAIITQIDNERGEIKKDINRYREYDPSEAMRLIQLFLKTWPKDDMAEDYKAALPELKKAAAERKKQEKAPSNKKGDN